MLTRADALSVARQLRFDARLAPTLPDGDIVAMEPRENSDELALVVALMIRAPSASVFERLRALPLPDFRAEPVAEVPLFSDTATNTTPGGDTGTATLPGSELSLLETAAKTGRGAFNLSTEEFRALADVRAEFQSASTGARHEVLAAAFLSLVAERAEAYRAGGLGAVAPYAREGADGGTPARVLGRATESFSVLRERIPEMQVALLGPSRGSDGVEHRYRRLAFQAEGRTVVALSHRLSVRRSEYAAVAERQFYVSSSYDALQTVLGCISLGTDTLVFYDSRTFTHRARELGRSLAYVLGRGKMREHVVKELEAMRLSLETVTIR